MAELVIFYTHFAIKQMQHRKRHFQAKEAKQPHNSNISRLAARPVPMGVQPVRLNRAPNLQGPQDQALALGELVPSLFSAAATTRASSSCLAQSGQGRRASAYYLGPADCLPWLRGRGPLESGQLRAVLASSDICHLLIEWSIVSFDPLILNFPGRLEVWTCTCSS